MNLSKYQDESQINKNLELEYYLKGNRIPFEIPNHFTINSFSVLPDPLNEIVFHHFCCLKAIQSKNYESLYTNQLAKSQAIIKSFDKNTLGRLFIILKELRMVAIYVDSKTNKENNKLEDATRTMMRAFNFCLNDRNGLELSRKWGAYYIASILFKSYIKLNTINLATNIVRAVTAVLLILRALSSYVLTYDANILHLICCRSVLCEETEFFNYSKAQLPSIHLYPKSHFVSFRYYLGMYYFWNEKWDDSFQELLYAFQHCHKLQKVNKRAILRFLLPMALLHGYLPHQQLLDRHHVAQVYGDIARSIKTGNLKVFDDALKKHERLLILDGTFLVVERVRVLVVRSLIKKIYNISDKNTRLSIQTIQAGFKSCSCFLELDEVECILANLIYKGLVKGYLSHEKRILVLSNNLPFPEIKNVVSDGISIL